MKFIGEVDKDKIVIRDQNGKWEIQLEDGGSYVYVLDNGSMKFQADFPETREALLYVQSL